MESVFEKYSDNKLYMICYAINKHKTNDIEDQYKNIHEICRNFGIKTEKIDKEFIYSLLKLNNFDDVEPKVLKRPELDIIKIDTEISESEYYNRIYRKEVSTYILKNEREEYFENEVTMGISSPWDGELIRDKYTDGSWEIDSVKIVEE